MLKDSTVKISHTFLKSSVLEWCGCGLDSRAEEWVSEYKGLWGCKCRGHSSINLSDEPQWEDEVWAKLWERWRGRLSGIMVEAVLMSWHLLSFEGSWNSSNTSANNCLILGNIYTNDPTAHIIKVSFYSGMLAEIIVLLGFHSILLCY